MDMDSKATLEKEYSVLQDIQNGRPKDIVAMMLRWLARCAQRVLHTFRPAT